MYDVTANPNGGLPIDLLKSGAASHRETALTTPSDRLAASKPAPGSPISADARKLCLGLEGASAPSPGLGLKDRQLAHIRQAVKKVQGNLGVERQAGIQGYESLQSALGGHRGPVLVLAPNGKPQFLFEWKGGQWHGYHAMTPFDRLAHQAPPSEALQKLFLDSGHAMYFSTYRVTGWKDAVQAQEEQGDLLILQEEERARGEDTAAILTRRLSVSAASDVDGDRSSVLQSHPDQLVADNLSEDGQHA